MSKHDAAAVETEPAEAWVDPMLSVKALPTLPAKDGALPDASAILAYLTDAGVAVKGDTVNVKSDGTVEVDTEDTKALAAAWKTYTPPVPVSPVTLREALQAELAAITTLPGLRTFLHDRLIPTLIADE